MGVFEVLGVIFGVAIILMSLMLFFPKKFKSFLHNFFYEQRNDMLLFVLIFLSLIILYIVLKVVPILYSLVIFFGFSILYWSLIFLFIPDIKNRMIDVINKEDDFVLRSIGVFTFILGIAMLFLSF